MMTLDHAPITVVQIQHVDLLLYQETIYWYTICHVVYYIDTFNCSAVENVMVVTLVHVKM